MFDPEDRCATSDGRALIKTSWDEYALLDLKIRADSLGLDFVEYLDQHIKDLCNPTNVWTFESPDQVTFTWTGAGGPERLFWSSYGEDVDQSGELRLPDGWQVCRLNYIARYRRKNHARFDIQPAFWWEGDDENPDRFRGYKYRIYLHGDPGNATNLILRNVEMVAIKSSLNNEERFRRGCDMPARNTGPTPSTKPQQKPQSMIGNAVISARLFENGNAATLVVRNTGAAAGRLTYLVRVLDGDDGKWEVAGDGQLNVPPGHELKIPFHKFGARDWDLQSL